MKLIEKKIELGGKELPGGKRHVPAATNVIDLVAVLQKSLNEAGKGARAPKRQPPPRRAVKKTAAKRGRQKSAA